MQPFGQTTSDLQPLWRKDDIVTALQSSSSSLSSFKKKIALVEICGHIVLGWENSTCSDPDELNTHRRTVPLSSSTREPFRTWGNRTAANIQHISTSPSAGSLNVSPWHYSETTLSQTSWDNLESVESSWNSSALIGASFFFLSFYKKNKAAVIKHSNILFQMSRRVFRLQRWNYLRLRDLINCQCIEMKHWTDIRGPQRMNCAQ